MKTLQIQWQRVLFYQLSKALKFGKCLVSLQYAQNCSGKTEECKGHVEKNFSGL